MWVLAIDTSAGSASVALLQGGEIFAEMFLHTRKNHSLILLPVVEKICHMSGVDIEDMDLFVCTVGPGSFTGIRIGLSTVKGFGIATGKPVIGVSTLDSLALNLAGSRVMVCPMLDAGKHHVYTALYRAGKHNMSERQGEEKVLELKSFLHSIEEDVIFLGEGAVKYEDIIRSVLPEKAYFAAGIQNYVRASMAGFLGELKLRAGEGGDPVSLMPRYLRRSEAEQLRINMRS